VPGILGLAAVLQSWSQATTSTAPSLSTALALLARCLRDPEPDDEVSEDDVAAADLDEEAQETMVRLLKKRRAQASRYGEEGGGGGGGGGEEVGRSVRSL
jgi:fructose-1,6-bisphosphatase/inositol monophosphatase family enzyme